MNVEVCLTPDLIHQHDLRGKTVVVVDIFRATSCIVCGLAYGIKSVYPVATVDECLAKGREGMIMAGERGGIKVPEFDIGNSPFEYQNDDYIGRDVAISTTNGTNAIEKSKTASDIIIGSFLNLFATAAHLKNTDQPLVVHCAGWKGTPNVEDTLYAGALIKKLEANCDGDSALLAKGLFEFHRDDLLSIARSSGHARRLEGFGVTRDTAFCMEQDRFDVVVRLEEDRLVRIS